MWNSRRETQTFFQQKTNFFNIPDPATTTTKMNPQFLQRKASNCNNNAAAEEFQSRKNVRQNQIPEIQPNYYQDASGMINGYHLQKNDSSVQQRSILNPHNINIMTDNFNNYNTQYRTCSQPNYQREIIDEQPQTDMLSRYCNTNLPNNPADMLKCSSPNNGIFQSQASDSNSAQLFYLIPENIYNKVIETLYKIERQINDSPYDPQGSHDEVHQMVVNDGQISQPANSHFATPSMQKYQTYPINESNRSNSRINQRNMEMYDSYGQNQQINTCSLQAASMMNIQKRQVPTNLANKNQNIDQIQIYQPSITNISPHNGNPYTENCAHEPAGTRQYPHFSQALDSRTNFDEGGRSGTYYRPNQQAVRSRYINDIENQNLLQLQESSNNNTMRKYCDQNKSNNPQIQNKYNKMHLINQKNLMNDVQIQYPVFGYSQKMKLGTYQATSIPPENYSIQRKQTNQSPNPVMASSAVSRPMPALRSIYSSYSGSDSAQKLQIDQFQVNARATTPRLQNIQNQSKTNSNFFGLNMQRNIKTGRRKRVKLEPQSKESPQGISDVRNLGAEKKPKRKYVRRATKQKLEHNNQSIQPTGLQNATFDNRAPTENNILESPKEKTQQYDPTSIQSNYQNQNQPNGLQNYTFSNQALNESNVLESLKKKIQKHVPASNQFNFQIHNQPNGLQNDTFASQALENYNYWESIEDELQEHAPTSTEFYVPHQNQITLLQIDTFANQAPADYNYWESNEDEPQEHAPTSTEFYVAYQNQTTGLQIDTFANQAPADYNYWESIEDEPQEHAPTSTEFYVGNQNQTTRLQIDKFAKNERAEYDYSESFEDELQQYNSTSTESDLANQNECSFKASLNFLSEQNGTRIMESEWGNDPLNGSLYMDNNSNCPKSSNNKLSLPKLEDIRYNKNNLPEFNKYDENQPLKHFAENGVIPI